MQLLSTIRNRAIRSLLVKFITAVAELRFDWLPDGMSVAERSEPNGLATAVDSTSCFAGTVILFKF